MGKSLDIVKAPKQKPITPKSVGDKQREKDERSFFGETDHHNDHDDKNDPLMFYLILGLCAIILLVALSVWLIYKSFNTADSSNTASRNQTEELADDTASVDSATTESTTDDDVESEAVATDDTDSNNDSSSSQEESSVNKASATVRVVNGNGRDGEAALMKTALEDDGFSNVTIGNASSQYSTTVIYYNTGKIAEAEAVDEVVSQNYETSLIENSAVTGSNDVVVALGAK